ncbi:MAG: hypothetical protein H0W88_12635, partial [Parachlamydiaceae bacterium]|nr:hypothetical protein [Parachlamydiaceae bacterium]
MIESPFKTATQEERFFLSEQKKPFQEKHGFFPPAKNMAHTNIYHEIPKLPVIDAIVNTILPVKGHLGDLESTVVIGVQHMLETTATLFKGLIDIGINPKNMYFIGKCYSTSPIVEKEIIELGVNVFPSTPPSKLGQYHEACMKSIEKMWELFLRESKTKKVTRLIILDEGGRCLETMPRNFFYKYEISGIEQTRGGLYSKLLDTFLFPLIDVASSVVKKQIEPPLVAEAVQKEVAKLLQDMNLGEDPIFGVVGNGAIGKGIVKYLLSCGYIVNVYDEDVNSFSGISDLKFCRFSDIKTLITNSDCIFGCTGKDITSDIDIFDIVQKDKIFVSSSSEDKEFLSALKKVGKMNKIISVNPLLDIICSTHTGHKITIAKGGFPMNFNREPWNVPANDIEVTQGLLLGSCIQAILNASSLLIDGFNASKLSRMKLDPYLQRFVLNHWIPRQPEGRYSEEHIKQFESID